MRISISALLLICVLLDGAAAGDDKRRDADVLFATANSLLGTGQPKSGPYTLKGHFRLVIAQPVEAPIQRAVLSEHEEWRTEISFPGYSETVLRNGSRTWRRRDAIFTPPRVGELLVLKPHFEVQEKEKVEKVIEQARR